MLIYISVGLNTWVRSALEARALHFFLVVFSMTILIQRTLQILRVENWEGCCVFFSVSSWYSLMCFQKTCQIERE